MSFRSDLTPLPSHVHCKIAKFEFALTKKVQNEEEAKSLQHCTGPFGQRQEDLDVLGLLQECSVKESLSTCLASSIGVDWAQQTS